MLAFTKSNGRGKCAIQGIFPPTPLARSRPKKVERLEVLAQSREVSGRKITYWWRVKGLSDFKGGGHV